MKVRLLASALAITMLPSCARIMHPERTGNSNGEIDIGPLIVDCLLFIPGILPGVIALAIDFGTGAIFINSRSSRAQDVPREGALALRPQRVPEGSTLHARIIDQDGTVLSEDAAIGSGRRTDLDLALEPAALAHAHETNVPLTLELQLDDGPVATQRLVMR